MVGAQLVLALMNHSAFDPGLPLAWLRTLEY